MFHLSDSLCFQRINSFIMTTFGMWIGGSIILLIEKKRDPVCQMISLGSHRAHSVFVICLEVASEKHCCFTVEKLLGSHGSEPCP